MTSIITPKIVHYCAQECAWQHSGELSVANMVEAWRFAHRRRNKAVLFRDIVALGVLVEPWMNRGGLRRQPVFVGWSEMLDWQSIPEALVALVASAELTPAQWFHQYEQIHPFVDGNGRTGSILHNWLLGRLDDPLHPPNLWDDPGRRFPGYPTVAVP